jgi:hypothetical protein
VSKLTLEERVELLERRGAGPRGPAGDITQAVTQATDAVHNEVQRAINRMVGLFVGATGETGPAPSHSLLESMIAQSLHDYGILTDGQVGQLLKYEIQKIVVAALSKKPPLPSRE